MSPFIFFIDTIVHYVFICTHSAFRNGEELKTESNLANSTCGLVDLRSDWRSPIVNIQTRLIYVKYLICV